MSETSSILNFLPKMLRFMRFSWVNLKDGNLAQVKPLAKCTSECLILLQPLYLWLPGKFFIGTDRAQLLGVRWPRKTPEIGVKSWNIWNDLFFEVIEIFEVIERRWIFCRSLSKICLPCVVWSISYGAKILLYFH